MEQRVIELFHRSIEAKMSVGEALAPKLVAASERCVAQLLAGGKLLCAGNGTGASLASTLCQNLMHPCRLERPGFSAICLTADSGLLSGIGDQHNFSEIFSLQVRTLAEPNDLLILFSSGEDPANLTQAIHAAHDRNINLIAFTGSGDTNLRSLLGAEDLNISIDQSDVHRIQEIQLLSLFALCDLIDEQLFGGIN
ncbi:SIS domain-containing protein [bacterium SCSIO 12696]|nr:SIS domain-containing protein [bacterium SCSIO 12696]